MPPVAHGKRDDLVLGGPVAVRAVDVVGPFIHPSRHVLLRHRPLALAANAELPQWSNSPQRFTLGEPGRRSFCKIGDDHEVHQVVAVRKGAQRQFLNGGKAVSATTADRFACSPERFGVKGNPMDQYLSGRRKIRRELGSVLLADANNRAQAVFPAVHLDGLSGQTTGREAGCSRIGRSATAERGRRECRCERHLPECDRSSHWFLLSRE